MEGLLELQNPLTNGVPLPREIWELILEFSPDSRSFLSLAMACKDTATVARQEAVQTKMKRRFSWTVSVGVRNLDDSPSGPSNRIICSYHVLPNGHVWNDHEKTRVGKRG